MSTTQIAASLFQLQQLDLDLERFATEQQAISQALQSNPALEKAHVEHIKAQQQLRASQRAQKEAEQSLDDLSRRLIAHEQRLYSGIITSPKELQSIQQEIQLLQTQHGRQEEKTLEIMGTTETLQENLQQKAEASQQADAAWVEASASLVAKRDQLESRQRELRTKRDQLAATIDATYVNRYETMRRSKQGKAVSRVEQNSCQWCRVILTPSELQLTRISKELQTCSNCGRILYYDR